MSVTVTIPANFYPNQRKIPTRYDNAPTGVWKAYVPVQGDASGGNMTGSITFPIEVFSKRIITLEHFAFRGHSSGSFQFTIAQIIGSGLLDQLPHQISVRCDANANMVDSIPLRLPIPLSWGYPVQLLTPGTSLTVITYFYPNSAELHALTVSGYWWDTTEPALKR